MAEGAPKKTTQQITIAATSRFPGFKFSPTDEELITYYLRKKLQGCEKSVEVIPEVEICRQEPWDLPGMAVIRSENEWFFFSARGRKYPNGTQSRRVTELGYWKATGKERIVRTGTQVIGTKRTLVFHKGRAPKGERTEWIMHEFCMVGKSQDCPIVCRLRRNTMFRPGDGTNRASSSQGPQFISGEENNTGSDEFVRKTTSSYGSHSTEQIESASESNRKLTNEAAVTVSSTHPKDKDDDGDNVDDYFADILKDDIINLDETPIPKVPMNMSLELSRLELEQPEPLQTVYPSETEAGGIKDHNWDIPTSDWSPTCIFTTMVAGKTWTRRLISGSVVAVLVAVVLSYAVRVFF